MNPFALGLLAVAVLAVVYGLVLRLWLLVEVPLWGDEAIVGLMARGIDGGHFTAFIWGQHYGGLESYVTALVLKVGGGGARALNATPALLCALGAVLVGSLTYAAGRNRPVAFAAAGAVWVWPYVVIWQSVREQGFREATLCCGLAALLCCVRVARRRAGPVTFVILGLALGLGWWASPEIVYFALPSAVLLAMVVGHAAGLGARRVGHRPFARALGRGRPRRRRRPRRVDPVVVRQRPHQLRLPPLELVPGERRRHVRRTALRVLPLHAADAARCAHRLDRRLGRRSRGRKAASTASCSS